MKDEASYHHHHRLQTSRPPTTAEKPVWFPTSKTNSFVCSLKHQLWPNLAMDKEKKSRNTQPWTKFLSLSLSLNSHVSEKAAERARIFRVKKGLRMCDWKARLFSFNALWEIEIDARKYAKCPMCLFEFSSSLRLGRLARILWDKEITARRINTFRAGVNVWTED